MNLMNKIIQSKERNKKIIFIAVICILIIGIVGLLVFNTIDNSSAKLDNKGNTASKISNNVKEKDKQNEKEDFKGMIEEKNKDSDEETSVISKNSLNISKKQVIQSIQTKKVMTKIKKTAQKVQRVMLKQTTRFKRTILIVQINQIPLINRIVPVQTVQIVQIILVDLFQNHHMNMFTEFLSLKRFIMMQ